MSREGHETLSVKNGCFEFMGAPTFFPGIFSIRMNGAEWLDSSFPEVGPKAWWNPWGGGLMMFPSEMNMYSLLKQSSSAEFVEMSDNHRNLWSGISFKTTITEHLKLKGLVFAQYYLTLPGVPALAYFTKIVDDGGRSFHHENWVTEMFVGGEQLKAISANVSESHKTKVYHGGADENFLKWSEQSFLSRLNRDEKLHIIGSRNDRNQFLHMSKDVVQYSSNMLVTKESGKSKTCPPQFLLFDHRSLSAEIKNDLRKISFE